MQTFLDRLDRFAFVTALIGAMAGCAQDNWEGGKLLVKGHVTDGGEPLQVKGRDVGIGTVRLAFYRIENGKRRLTESASTAADAEGRFSLVDGIVPGEYKISVEQWDPYPEIDRLHGKFNAEQSQIVRKIENEEEIEIDVSRPTG